MGQSARIAPVGQELIDRALAAMAERSIIARIWRSDHTVWKPESQEIGNRLGWLQAGADMVDHLPRIEGLAHQVREAGYIDTVLLGMGGSSLAPDVFGRTFDSSQCPPCVHPRPRLHVLDSTSPGAVLALAESLDLARTLFVLSTKSGGTVETLSMFKYFFNRVAEAVGEAHAGEHFVAITDPASRLADIAECYGFRATFINDPNIGGRFSVLSFFGLTPAAMICIDLNLLLTRAAGMADRCGADAPVRRNPAAPLGAAVAEHASAGRDKLTFAISPAVASFGDWVEQLIAESLGKDGQGVVPVVGEPLGPANVYSADRVFVHIRLADDDTHDAALAELEAAGHPVIRLAMRDAYDLGEQFFLWEMATAIAGHRMGVNPFDQPNVEAAKTLARQMVAEYQERGALPDAPAFPLSAEALAEFLAQAKPGDYIAIHAYVQPTPEMDQALAALRTRLRDSYRLATTVGYGPRFLHSTGQLHKGGANNGLFIQLVGDEPRDAPIPDEAGAPTSSISFGVLKDAQALGDWRALAEAGRRVIRFTLSTDAEGRLAKLAPAY